MSSTLVYEDQEIMLSGGPMRRTNQEPVFNPPNTVFMRSSEPYDLSKMNQYYMVGRADNSFYIFQKPLPADSDLNGVFASTDYQTLNNQQIIVTLNRVEGSIYKIYGDLGSTRGSFIVNETDRIISLTSSSTPSDVLLNTVNLFNGDASNLYPGVWYRLINSKKEQLRFNIQNCSSPQQPFCTPSEGTSLSIMDIGFIPINGISSIESTINKKDYYLYKWTEVEGKKSCGKIEGDKTLGLEWFTDWLKNTSNAPVNCDTGTYIGPNSNNCNFSSLEACEFGFLYNLGGITAPCSPAALGTCSIVDNKMVPCVPNFNVVPPTAPLFCDIPKLSDSPWSKWVALFPDDSPEYVPILAFVGLLIGIILILGLIIWGIVRNVKRSKNHKKNTDEKQISELDLSKLNKNTESIMSPVVNSGMSPGINKGVNSGMSPGINKGVNFGMSPGIHI